MQGLRWLVACAAPFLSACATLSIDPSLQHTAIWRLPAECGGAAATELRTGELASVTGASNANAALCNQLALAQHEANRYLHSAVSLDNEHQIYGALQLSSGASLAGFSLFQAHPHNTSAALLTGGTAATLDSGLRAPDRARVYATALNAVRCVNTAALPFLSSGGERVYQSRIARAAWLEDAERALPLVSNMALSKMSGLAEPATLFAAGAAFERSNLRISRAIRVARIDAGAQRDVALRVADALLGIETYRLQALAQLPIDLGAVATRLREPPKQAAEEPAAPGVDSFTLQFRAAGMPGALDVGSPVAAFGSMSAALADPTARVSMQSFATFALSVDALVTQMAPIAEDGAGREEYAQIAQCVPTLPPAAEEPPTEE